MYRIPTASGPYNRKPGAVPCLGAASTTPLLRSGDISRLWNELPHLEEDAERERHLTQASPSHSSTVKNGNERHLSPKKFNVKNLLLCNFRLAICISSLAIPHIWLSLANRFVCFIDGEFCASQRNKSVAENGVPSRPPSPDRA